MNSNARASTSNVFSVAKPNRFVRPNSAALSGVCFARVGFGTSGSVQFILANGLLVGIPPQTGV